MVIGSRFAVSERALGRGLLLAVVEGEIDMATREELTVRLLAAARAAERGLVVDLSAVEFMGAAGIHALEGARTELARRGGALAVVAPGGTPFRILDVTKLTETFNVAPSLDAALRKFS